MKKKVENRKKSDYGKKIFFWLKIIQSLLIN